MCNESKNQLHPKKGANQSIADKYYGAIKVEKWPEHLDELLVKLITENASKNQMNPLKNSPNSVSGNSSILPI